MFYNSAARGARGTCAECGADKRLGNFHPKAPGQGRICSNCQRKINAPVADCGRCGNHVVLPYRWRKPTSTPSGQRASLSALFEKPGRADAGLYTKVRICSACYRAVRAPRGYCARCNEQTVLPNRLPRDRSKRICGSCFAKLSSCMAACGECGEEKELRHYHPTDKSRGKVCASCNSKLTRALEKCPVCNKQRRLAYRNPDDPAQYICSSCHRAKTVPRALCFLCKVSKRLPYTYRHEGCDERVCSRCAKALRTPEGNCAVCQHFKPLAYHHPSDTALGRICGECRRKAVSQNR